MATGPQKNFDISVFSIYKVRYIRVYLTWKSMGLRSGLHNTSIYTMYSQKPSLIYPSFTVYQTVALPSAMRLSCKIAVPTPQRAELMRLRGVRCCPGLSQTGVGLLRALDWADTCSSGVGDDCGWGWNFKVIITSVLPRTAIHVQRVSDGKNKHRPIKHGHHHQRVAQDGNTCTSSLWREKQIPSYH